MAKAQDAEEELVAVLRAAAEDPDQIEDLAAAYMNRHSENKAQRGIPWAGWYETLGWIALFGTAATVGLLGVWINFHPKHAFPGSDPWGWEGWAAWLCGFVASVIFLKWQMMGDERKRMNTSESTYPPVRKGTE